MAGREQPYDPYIPSGGSGHGGSAGYEGSNTRTAAIQSVCAYVFWNCDGSCCAIGQAGLRGADSTLARSYNNEQSCSLLVILQNGIAPNNCDR